MYEPEADKRRLLLAKLDVKLKRARVATAYARQRWILEQTEESEHEWLAASAGEEAGRKERIAGPTAVRSERGGEKLARVPDGVIHANGDDFPRHHVMDCHDFNNRRFHHLLVVDHEHL